MRTSLVRIILVVSVLFMAPALAVAVSSDDRSPATFRGAAAGEAEAIDPDLEWGGAPTRGWPFHLGNPFGSPAFYDVDGDGIKEIVVGDEARAYVLDLAGNVRPGWPRGIGSCDHTPAFGDIDGDGTTEILFGARGIPPKLHAFSPDGTPEPGWPVSLPYQGWLNVSCPVVADMNGDDRLDVGIASELGVSFFDGRGIPLPGWPYTWVTTQNLVWSGPAVADLDGDGALEAVVGNNCFLSEAIHAIRADGTAMPGWPKYTEAIFSSPAVGDLDGDGDLEIAIQEGDPGWYGNMMHVLHHDGSYLPGWPRQIAPQWESSRSNPAIVDLTGDGKLEIVSVTGDGLLHAFHADGSEAPGFPVTTPATDPISSPQVVDVDDDGIEEVFLCYYQGGNQWIAGLRLDGSLLPGFPKLLLAGVQLNAHGSAHIDDPDADGDLDVVACGTDFDDGSLCFYEIDGSIHGLGTRMDWPKIRHDARNTGYYSGEPSAGIETLDGSAAPLRIFPNPVTAGRPTSVTIGPASGGRIAVFDVSGRRLLEQVVTGSSATLRIRGPAGAQAAPGIYLVEWRLPGGAGARVSTARLVVLPD